MQKKNKVCTQTNFCAHTQLKIIGNIAANVTILYYVVCYGRYQRRKHGREIAKKELNQAMKDRDVTKIEKAKDLCLIKGVDETTINKAEKLLEILQEKDILLEKIDRYLKKADLDNLSKAIEKFRFV